MKEVIVCEGVGLPVGAFALFSETRTFWPRSSEKLFASAILAITARSLNFTAIAPHLGDRRSDSVTWGMAPSRSGLFPLGKQKMRHFRALFAVVFIRRALSISRSIDGIVDCDNGLSAFVLAHAMGYAAL